MARQYNDPIGGTFVIPAAYPSITVATANGGLATTGVLAIVGEAEAGPAFSEETGELQDNAFGPDQFADVVAKYKSGRIVDAFRAAASAVVDPQLAGTFSQCIIVKTNVGAKASAAINGIDSLSYTSLTTKSAGQIGNLIYFNVTNPTLAALATSGTVTYIPPVAADKLVQIVANGTRQANVTAPVNPTLAVSLIEALDNVSASGGADRSADVGVGTVTVAPTTGKSATFSVSGTWAAAVAVGDTLVVPDASALGGTNSQNVGAYQITSISANRKVATAVKLSDAGKTTPSPVAGTVTTPVDDNAVVTAGDIKIYAPISFTVMAPNLFTPARQLAGVSTTLEVAEPSVVEEVFYAAGGVKASWVSVSGAPVVIKAASELTASLNVNRQSDGVAETIVAGGEVGLEIGNVAAGATFTVGATTVTLYDGTLTTVIALADYPTIADLATYISSITGWVAAPNTAMVGNLPSTALDQGTFHCSSYEGAKTARIKTDAYRMEQALLQSSVVSFSTSPTAGLPIAFSAYQYLAGGAKGGTTGAQFSAGIDALQKVRCNFVIPLVSRDASEDIADGLTDATSTYEIDAVNSYSRGHVHAMSTMKAKKNRQAFLSKRGVFTVVGESAANIASSRCAMVFQDVKSAVTGSIVQYQPWFGAVLAAATQAGAFYRSVVRKQVNTTGVVQAAGDWTYALDSNLENALNSGLNPIRRAEEGGFVWVSDQTTYGKDNNNVYNSIQMVYAADTVALTTAQRMDRAFVGQSVADVSANVALSFLDGIMADFLRLKLIAPSSDAPRGYRNAQIVIQGPVMRVSVEVKIAGSIYFIPISFYVTEITQTATGA
jgi:hypothetical protein